MENTMMNEVNNEIVEAVVENLPEAPVVDEISKSNIIDSVKGLASYSYRNFKMIDTNERGFRDELDELHNSVASIADLNTAVDALQKKMKLCGVGLIAGGVGFTLLGGYLLLSKLKSKKEEVVGVVEPEDVQEEVVQPVE